MEDGFETGLTLAGFARECNVPLPLTALRLFLETGTAGFGAMSLNRNEQTVFDYLQSNPDEKNHWLEKVREIAGGEVDVHAAAVLLARELWAYYEERAGVVSPFKELAAREGLKPTSMRNLAEYLLRIWVAPKPGRKRSNVDSSGNQ